MKSYRRGFAPKFSLDDQQAIFRDRINEFIVNGCLVRSNSQIFIETAEEFNIKNPQTIYLNAKRFYDRSGILKPKPKYKADDESDYDFDCDMAFKVDIGSDSFLKNYIENKQYLKGARSFLRQLVWSLTKFPCNWQFKHLKFIKEELVCLASCTECKGNLSITTTNDRCSVSIATRNIDPNKKHAKKSLVTGEYKEHVQSILKKNTPYVTRSILANEMMSAGDDEPARLPSTATLTKQKYRANKTEPLHEDPAIAISIMKNETQYSSTIQNIGLNPFFVLYMTPTQNALFQTETKRSRIILSVDATGISVRLSPYSSISSRRDAPKRCFLYAMTLRLCDDKSVPVFQMLSQLHSTTQINTMFSTFKSQIIQKNPHEIIMDKSAALMLSSVLTFSSSSSVHEYLDHCFESLFGTRKAPTTYIRLDRSHTVHSINKNKKLRHKVTPNVSIFYRRLLGFFIQESQIKVIQDLIQCMFIILNTRCIHSGGVQSILQRLEQVTQSHKIETISHEIIVPDPDFEFGVGKNKFQNWIQEIVLRVHAEYIDDSLNDSNENTIGVEKNAYYAPHLEKPLMEFLYDLPLCGNILNAVFDSQNFVPTSSATETDFDVIKNDLFHASHGIRVDEWLKKHISFTDGRLAGKRAKEVRSILFDESPKKNRKPESYVDGKKNVTQSDSSSQSNESTDDYSESESDDCDDPFDENLQKFENFGGLNEDGIVPKRKQKRASSSILNAQRPNKRVISILSNGATTNSSKGVPAIVTSNACSFNSIFHTFAICYVDNKCFSDELNELNDPFSSMMKSAIEKWNEKSINKARNLLLLEYFAERMPRKPGKVINLNCNTTIDYMFRKICATAECANSIYEVQNCGECLMNFEKKPQPYFPVNLKEIDVQNIAASFPPRIQSSNQNVCTECGVYLQKVISPKSVLIIDVDYSEKGSRSVTQISNISDNFTYALKSYKLKAIIERLTICGGHFVTHVRRNDQLWETYDDLHTFKPKPAKPSKYVRASLLIYCLTGGFIDIRISVAVFFSYLGSNDLFFF